MNTNARTYGLPDVVKHYADYSQELQQPEKTIFDLLKPTLSNMRMLDIGVGGGRTTLHFAPLVKTYTGIDFSAGMIEICKSRLQSKFPNAVFETGDVRNLSTYADHSFDFVFFSFNGLDNINHEERLAALKEIRRICARNGYFCFSSHNLQCLPDFFKIRFRLHPFKFLKSLINRKRLLKQNKEAIDAMQTAPYVNVYDDVYDFGLHTYYIRPSHQVEQLQNSGFNHIKLFSLDSGKELTDKTEQDKARDSWIYYLCQ